MKKLKIGYLSLKATVLLSFLSVLGFSACDGGDVQPEYGVRAVRDKAIIEQQKNNDAIVKETKEIKTEEEVSN